MKGKSVLILQNFLTTIKLNWQSKDWTEIEFANTPICVCEYKMRAETNVKYFTTVIHYNNVEKGMIRKTLLVEIVCGCGWFADIESISAVLLINFHFF